MIKTQIQFPDSLYQRIKALAAEQEWSVAETLRRGVELLLATRPVSPKGDGQPWALEPPANTELFHDPFTDEDWRLDVSLGGHPSEIAGFSSK